MERKYYLRGLGIGIVVTAIIMGMALPKNKGMTDEEVIARAKELGLVENTALGDLQDDGEVEENENGGTKGDKPEASAPQDGVMPQQKASGQESPGKTDEAKAESGKTDSKVSDQDGSASVKSGADSEDIGDGREADEARTDTGKGDTASGIDSNEDTVKPKTSQTEPSEAGQKPDTDENGGTDGRPQNTNGIITSAEIKTITVNSGDGSHTVARKLADAGVVTSAETFDAYMCEHGYDKRLRTGTFSIPADASDEQIARIVTGAE